MTKPSVLLIEPGYIPDSLIERLATSTMPPLGILQVAAVLEQAGFPCNALDFSVMPMDGRLQRTVQKHDPAFVGFSCTAPCLPHVQQMVREIRDMGCDAVLICGGYDATARPEVYLERGLADVVVIGEGEETTPRLLEAWPNIDDIPGIAFMRDGKMVDNGVSPRVKDLDVLPYPSRHLLDMSRYKLAPGYRKSPRSTSVFFTRGCPHRCTFCDRTIFGQKLTFRSADSVIDELKYLNRTYGTNEFRFHDDRFLAHPRKAEELLDKMIEQDLGFHWLCAERVDRLDARLLKKMKAAGCYRIESGVEAGSQRVLDLIKKGIKKQQAVEGFRKARDAGISVLSNFILGFPTETRDEMYETIEFSLELDPDYAAFFMFQPYPGTAVAKEFGLPWDDDHRRFSRLAHESYTLTNDEMESVIDDAYKAFYLHPTRCWRLAKQISHPEDLLTMSMAAVSMLRGGFAGGTNAPPT
jgi:anaerobic magnesium-protoporphyrin IX monomethyl ester cyclase